jgi:hypothetical protein
MAPTPFAFGEGKGVMRRIYSCLIAGVICLGFTSCDQSLPSQKTDDVPTGQATGQGEGQAPVMKQGVNAGQALGESHVYVVKPGMTNKDKGKAPAKLPKK